MEPSGAIFRARSRRRGAEASRLRHVPKRNEGDRIQQDWLQTKPQSACHFDVGLTLRALRAAHFFGNSGNERSWAPKPSLAAYVRVGILQTLELGAAAGHEQTWQ